VPPYDNGDENSGEGLDHPCSSSLLTHWRSGSGVCMKSGNAFGKPVPSHVPCTVSSANQLSLHDQLTLHASELHLDISEMGIENYSLNQGCNGPETSEISNTSYEGSPAASLACVPSLQHEHSAYQHVTSSASPDTALGENVSQACSRNLAQMMPKLRREASISETCSDTGMNSPGNAVDFPWKESIFLAQGSVLSHNDWRALQAQLDQLASVSESVRQASISDASGDVLGHPGLSMCRASSLDALMMQTGKQRELSKPEESEIEEYEDDFEDEEDSSERCRSEWMEQRRRHAVQRLWNIEAAEPVPEEICTVTGTPHILSSSDDEAVAAEHDKESVVDEELSQGLPPAASAHPSSERRNEVQRRLVEREQKLRARCIEQLGESTYNKLYDFLRNHAKLYSEDHDVAMSIELTEFLDESEMAFWPLVDELVYFDETVRNEHMG